MKNVVITGASGFLGGALTGAFLNNGDEVFAVVKKESEIVHLPEHININPIICDFIDYERLSVCINKPVDYFVHLAWAGVAGAESKQIVTQVENIKAACLAMEQANILQVKRFLFAGSSYQYRMEAFMLDGKFRKLNFLNSFERNFYE